MPTSVGAIKILISTLSNWLGRRTATRQQVKPDDHSEVVPLLPIPNRTVKRLCADDSADSRVKVGHCQANIPENARACSGVFFSGRHPKSGCSALESVSKRRLTQSLALS